MIVSRIVFKYDNIQIFHYNFNSLLIKGECMEKIHHLFGKLGDEQINLKSVDKEKRVRKREFVCVCV